MKYVVHSIVCAVLASNSFAQHIEEIEVVGQNINRTAVNVDQHFTITEAVLPTTIYTPGGIGGFSGFNERGAQVIHTAVYKNGVPANDPSNGWYDFAHDTATGNEIVKVVNGPNGVLYGSGSLGGAVFLTDSINDESAVRFGSNEHTMFTSSLGSVINFNGIMTENRSVRTDNNETDSYKNFGVKTMFDIADFEFAGNVNDYKYDFDQCWNNWGIYTNDCTQEGQRINLSARNNNISLGYNRTDTEYFALDDNTWSSTGERYFVDLKDIVETDRNTFTYGAQYEDEHYVDSRSVLSGYALANFDNIYDIGVRYNKYSTTVRTGFDVFGVKLSLGTSYRLPTLYELNGDSWVVANPNLEAEEATGVEVAYSSFSVYRYEFDQGIDYNFNTNQYVNTGEYVTQGIRYNHSYELFRDRVNVFLGYTDSDIGRVPKYKSSISYISTMTNGYTATARWVTEFDKGVDFTGQPIDDANTVELVIDKKVSNHYSMSFLVQDLFNHAFEIVPGYRAGGRTYYLTISYR